MSDAVATIHVVSDNTEAALRCDATSLPPSAAVRRPADP